MVEQKKITNLSKHIIVIRGKRKRVKIKEINKERYAKIISKISQEQQKELNDFVDQVSENHPLFKYKNKYTSATVIKELKLEMSAYLTERESANQSKMHALHERQRRVTNLN
jgi:REP element-mobilizing transposase RayT